MPTLTRDAEADRLLGVYEDQPARVMELLERQLAILHQRAQLLLGLAGVVITVTGFSGRLIAGTSRLAQMLVVGGVSLALLSAVVLVAGVLSLRWLTQQPGDLLRPWVLTCLAYRDRKTRWYFAALVLLVAGAALYVAAIALMLLDPAAGA